MTDLIVAGVDLSLTSTGLARSTEELHRIRTKGKRDDTLAARRHRLDGIAQEVCDFCEYVDLVVIEAPAFGAPGGSVHDRSGLWWLVVDRILDLGGPVVVEVSPTARAKYATGGRRRATRVEGRLPRRDRPPLPGLGHRRERRRGRADPLRDGLRPHRSADRRRPRRPPRGPRQGRLAGRVMTVILAAALLAFALAAFWLSVFTDRLGHVDYPTVGPDDDLAWLAAMARNLDTEGPSC